MNPTDPPTLTAIRIHPSQDIMGAENAALRPAPENAASSKQLIGTHPMVLDRHP